MMYYRLVILKGSQQWGKRGPRQLGEEVAEKPVFVTTSLEDVEKMGQWSADVAYQDNGSHCVEGLLLTFEADEVREASKAEKIGHDDRTDSNERVIVKGRVMAVEPRQFLPSF